MTWYYLFNLLDEVTSFGQLVLVGPQNLLARFADGLELFRRPLLNAHQGREVVLDLLLSKLTPGSQGCQVLLTGWMVGQVGLERLRRGRGGRTTDLQLPQELAVCHRVGDEAGGRQETEAVQAHSF